MYSLVALLLAACTPEGSHEPLDLAEPLGDDQARAGVIRSVEPLFGGISAEAQPGDVLLYNDRVRFVIQGIRAGDYYVGQGGSVIDADIVRPAGEPGHDAVEEWAGMYGFGRVQEPLYIAVSDDGSDGGAARVVVEGVGAPMAVLPGALEAPDLVDDLGLRIRTEYRLAPGSWFLEVTSTVHAADEPVSLALGDVLIAAPEVMDRWGPGGGLLGDTRGASWVGWTGHRDDVSLVLATAPGEAFQSGGPTDLLSELAELVSGFAGTFEIPAGGSASFSRRYGVGPDLATLSDALLGDTDTDLVEGQVTAPDGPVAGARVNVLVDDAPYTLAVSDDQGRFAARVPAGAATDVLAVGDGHRRFTGVDRGTATWSPFAAPATRSATLDALRNDRPVGPSTEGRGVADPAEPLVLGEPGTLVVEAADGLPFEVRAYRQGEAPSRDTRLVPAGPGGGAWAMGWAPGGTATLSLRPGTYDLVAHRGQRFEHDAHTVTVEAGETASVQVTLEQAYEHAGWLLADPHSHASPSGDGGISMEDRLVVMASVGVQLHFGTDHDRVADYGPLLAPLGLEGVLNTVIADEVSPVVRGHHNVYPLVEVPEQPNNGAWHWWTAWVDDTAAMHAALRARHGDDVIIQANHPDDGLARVAGWSPGRIGDPDFWSEDFDAIEVINAGGFDGYEFWLDMVARGLPVTPVGVSDSHTHTGGSPGYSATFLHLGIDDPADYTPEALKEAMRAGRTVVSRGPFLDLSVLPGSTVTGSTTLDVEALHPSWLTVDRLILLRDGVEVEVVEGSSATFDLAPEADAFYVVVAEGDDPMPVVGKTPWAMSGAIKIDVAGDGWQPPLPALELTR